jgi:NAD(P)-dependent dehydrogenase (short-subunit alcohol dehydrogenase family)
VRIENPVVVITGASSGIGRAAALRFAKRGARLVLAARSASSLADVVAQCTALGATAIAVPTDVSDENQVQQLMQTADEEFGQIDVCVSCASVHSYGRFEDTPPDVFRQVLETNLFGQVYASRAVLPYFRRRESGVLILVGSVYSKLTTPLASPYATSKFALRGFGESLREELHGSGISLCMVLPATVDTPVYQHAANYTGKRTHPLPPASSPERVARAIVRLADRPRKAVVIGQLQRTMIPVHSMLPGFYQRGISPVMKALAMRGGKVPPTAGTVFQPDPASNEVSGHWRSAPLRVLWFSAAGTAVVGVVRVAGRATGPSGRAAGRRKGLH